MKFFRWLDLPGQKRLSWGLLFCAMLVYGLNMSFQSILRYTTFKATAFDLGNMDQVVWNTIHGRLFQFTNQAIDWYGPPNRLGVHVEPILLLISLLYYFWADPRTLLILQTVALTAGAPAVFLLARRYLPAWPLIAAIFAVAYLLSPTLIGLNIFDFHPDCLATPFLLYALVFLTYRRYGWFLFFCFLTCTTKEDMPLAVAFLGLLLIWKYRLPRLGLVLLLGGLLWTYICFKWVIPHFYTGVASNNFWYRYSAYGSSPTLAILNLLTHPWLIFSQILTMERVYYVFSLLRSTGFLAILAPEWLLPALPKAASNFLSTNGPNYSGVYHYNAAVIPFAMLSAIHGARRLLLIWQSWRGENFSPVERERLLGRPAPDTDGRPYSVGWLPAPLRRLGFRLWQRLAHLTAPLRSWLARRSRPVRHLAAERWLSLSARMFPLAKRLPPQRLQAFLGPWLLFFMGLNLLLIAPILNSFWADHQPGVREQQIQQLINMIPPYASVSASDNLNPHVSERQYVTVFPTICFDPPTCNHIAQFLLVDLNTPTLTGNRADAINKLNALSRQYHLVKKIASGIELWEHNSSLRG